MNIKKEFLNYKTSNDFKLLFELVMKQRIVCFITKENGHIIIAANTASTDNEHISIGTQGIGYIDAFQFDDKTLKQDFIEQCEYYKLEFIIP